VGKRKFNDMHVVLYQLDTFYVEIYYRTYRNEISNLVISEDTNVLQEYPDQINVTFLKK
jgi:hypothetical protein